MTQDQKNTLQTKLVEVQKCIDAGTNPFYGLTHVLGVITVLVNDVTPIVPASTTTPTTATTQV